MSDDQEKLRRSATARAFYHRYRAQAFDNGYFSSPSRNGSAGAVEDFGSPKKPRSSDGQEIPGAADVTQSVGGTKSPSGETSGNSWVAPPGTYRSKNGTGRSRWDPASLSDVIGFEVRKRGWDQTLSVASITGDWEQIVGPQVAEHCPIESFEGGTLIARADSTAWAQQLQLLLPHIHKRIDERVGPGVVEKVVVRPPQAPSWVKGKRTFRGGRGPRDTYG